LRVKVERLEKELQSLKDTNVVLTTEKMELTARIAQLEENFKGKTPVDGLAVSPNDTTKILQDDQLLGLSIWVHAAKTLEYAYLYDREVFFLLMEVEQSVTLSTNEFATIGARAKSKGLENLFVEILLRDDLTVEDYAQAYWKFGDLGVRSFL
jgi:hypothetical protein